MFFEEALTFLRAFWNNNFGDTIQWWGLASGKTAISVDWCSVAHWCILLAILLIGAFVISVRSKHKVSNWISKHILGFAFIVWLAGVIVYIVGFYNDGVNGLSVVLRAIIASFKMFVVSHELARVPLFLQSDASYMAIFSLVHFAAAFITFVFIFKMVGYKMRCSAAIIWYKLKHAEGKTVHLFWGINEASLSLAESISKRNWPDEKIIFVDVDVESNDNSQKKTTLSSIANVVTIDNSEIKRLESINALVDHCYNGPAAFNSEENPDIFNLLHLRNIGAIVRKSRQVNFYFMSDDEAQNIAGALNLQRDQRICLKKNKPTIYVHARKEANNEVLDHYSQYQRADGCMKINVVDSAYLSAAILKGEERALPVNCVDVDKETGFVNSSFTSLIVGFGSTGQEAFKFLYEFSAFVGSDLKKSPFKCYAIDRQMNKIAGLIREKMPAIGEDELSLIQTEVDSEAFWTKVREIITELNYVVIALNDDTEGLSLAVNLFKHALMHRSAEMPMLKIMIRCYERSSEERMTEVIKALNQSIEGKNIEICIYGEQEKLYCCDTILSDVIMSKAKKFNCVYENSSLSGEEQWEKNFGNQTIDSVMRDKKISRYHAIHDINRRVIQNVANAQHSLTKMLLMGFAANELSERLKLYLGYVNEREADKISYKCGTDDATLLQNIARVEHERWIASHKLMGYTYAPKTDCVKKQHECMCAWDDLDEKTKSYDCNVVDTTIKLAYDEQQKDKQ